MAKKTKKSSTSKKQVKVSKTKAKRERHKYHHHIRFGVLIIAILTVCLIIATIMSYPKFGPKDVVAKVNGEAITQAELDLQYDRIPIEYKSLVTKEVILDQMINEKVLLQEAAKKGITVTEAEVDEIITMTMSQIGLTQEQLDERLAQQGMTMADLKDLYMKQLKITKLMEEEVFPNINVTEEELKEFYDSRIHARHILVTTEEEAKEIISFLDEGDDFAELAADRSTEPGVIDGDLGEFGRGQMVPEFEEVAYALDINEISQEPVQTQFGYHVIQRLPREQTFEESKGELTLALQQQRQTDAVTDYLQQVKDKANIEILKKDLEN
ncbi:MAG: SurA N-terminal domain-containing protein [Nanoarchaeota archaeon]|nr:SurA N-terminal domain-containing protein [Nanoarchaeota archaeon]